MTNRLKHLLHIDPKPDVRVKRKQSKNLKPPKAKPTDPKHYSDSNPQMVISLYRYFGSTKSLLDFESPEMYGSDPVMDDQKAYQETHEMCEMAEKRQKAIDSAMLEITLRFKK